MPGHASSQVVELARGSAVNANRNCLVIGFLLAFQTLNVSPHDPVLAGSSWSGRAEVRVRRERIYRCFFLETTNAEHQSRP